MQIKLLLLLAVLILIDGCCVWLKKEMEMI